MPVLAFMFQFALELYNVEVDLWHYCLYKFSSKHCSWWEEFLQMEVYLKCSAITRVFHFFSIISFIFSTKMKYDVCYTVMNLADQVLWVYLSWSHVPGILYNDLNPLCPLQRYDTVSSMGGHCSWGQWRHHQRAVYFFTGFTVQHYYIVSLKYFWILH